MLRPLTQHRCLSDLGGSTCFLYLFESAYLEHWKARAHTLKITSLQNRSCRA